MTRAEGAPSKEPNRGWRSITASLTALVTLSGAPGHLYAGLVNGEVWHTADYGANWRQMPFNLGAVWFSLLIV